MSPDSPFPISARAKDLHLRVQNFAREFIAPAEPRFNALAAQDPTSVIPLIEQLKAKAQAEGLWNLFLPDSERGGGLTNVEYAPIAEVCGYYKLLAETMNCSAPDTGNMEVLERYGSPQIKERWLMPLLRGEIRSAFCMTEPDVASSDATNIQSRIARDGDHYIINGRKWWSSGAGDPRCKVLIFMGKTNPDAPRHGQQSMIVIPADTEGVRIKRLLTVFGYHDAPYGHAEIEFRDVRVPVHNMLLGEGRGFEIAQARLGPGRIHHCMRSIGIAERALEAMCRRVQSRVAFGQRLADMGSIRQDIARSRVEIDQCRWLVLHAAHRMDTVGNKEARLDIASIKVAAPAMSLRVLDRAIQAHGGLGVCQDSFLAMNWAIQRTLRLADGPDEVHLDQIARLELRKHRLSDEGGRA